MAIVSLEHGERQSQPFILSTQFLHHRKWIAERVPDEREKERGRREFCAKLVESGAEIQSRGDPQHWVPVSIFEANTATTGMVLFFENTVACFFSQGKLYERN